MEVYEQKEWERLYNKAKDIDNFDCVSIVHLLTFEEYLNLFKNEYIAQFEYILSWMPEKNPYAFYCRETREAQIREINTIKKLTLARYIKDMQKKNSLNRKYSYWYLTNYVYWLVRVDKAKWSKKVLLDFPNTIHLVNKLFNKDFSKYLDLKEGSPIK